MIFFYCLDTSCCRTGLSAIKIPQWKVHYGVDNVADLYLDWFEWGERHEEFKAGDYGTSKYSRGGTRKLTGYLVLHCVEAENFLEFEEYIKRTCKNAVIQRPARYLNQIDYGMTVEYYMVVKKP